MTAAELFSGTCLASVSGLSLKSEVDKLTPMVNGVMKK